MADLADFGRDMARVKRTVQREIPKTLAEALYAQTMESFDEQAYTGDDKINPWPARIKEKYLRYPKLNYTGRLRSSIQTFHNPTMAGIGTNVHYAKVHNEGGRSDGSRFIRNPPYSTKRINRPVGKIQKRQFMGVGKRTYKAFQFYIGVEFNKILRR